jgi:hypothetical protein
LMQANGQGRGAELTLQQLPFSATHATKDERMHGRLRCGNECCGLCDTSTPSHSI